MELTSGSSATRGDPIGELADTSISNEASTNAESNSIPLTLKCQFNNYKKNRNFSKKLIYICSRGFVYTLHLNFHHSYDLVS